MPLWCELTDLPGAARPLVQSHYTPERGSVIVAVGRIFEDVPISMRDLRFLQSLRLVSVRSAGSEKRFEIAPSQKQGIWVLTTFLNGAVQTSEVGSTRCAAASVVCVC